MNARRFPENTCPASRHAELIADSLDEHERSSVRATCEALWKARDELKRRSQNANEAHRLLAKAAAENARLREALEKISSPTQSRDLLWWQLEARRALGQHPEAPAADREWWVVSTALADGFLMLSCSKTGANGIVRDPTKEEWSEAFSAPSNPYQWAGGDDRVEVTTHGPETSPPADAQRADEALF